MIVDIEITYIPTDTLYAAGQQDLETVNDYDQLKDLISKAVRGKLDFFKMSDYSGRDMFIGREMLIQSKIVLLPNIDEDEEG